MLLWQNVSKLKLKYFLKSDNNQRLLFESCRSAINFAITHAKESKKCKIVYVCDFTCEAVKEAIDAVGIETIRYSLNQSL